LSNGLTQRFLEQAFHLLPDFGSEQSSISRGGDDCLFQLEINQSQGCLRLRKNGFCLLHA
jgi:hypothetical protein